MMSNGEFSRFVLGCILPIFFTVGFIFIILEASKNKPEAP